MSTAHSPRRAARIGVTLLALSLLAQGCRTAAPALEREPAPVAPPPMLVPAPASLTVRDGAPFALVATTAIVAPADSEARAVAEGLARLLRPATGFALPVVTPRDTTAAAIVLELDATRFSLGDEGYELDASASTLHLRAARPAGLFRGVQTIRQLLPARVESDIPVSRTAWLIPAVSIADAPRFAWRGAMLDVSRHFFSVREVEQFIDLLALYKMNVLHLHLSDDQGWRIEIRSRPLLTQVGAASQVGGRTGGFYTQADYAELVRYAAERYVTIVPEIDMPGHTNAALSAYPAVSCSTRPAQRYTGIDVGWSTFCVDSEATYALVDDIVRELAAITPGPFLHLGGDEVHTLAPAQYIRFVERVQDIAARHGKRMIGWEEIAQAHLSPTTVAQHWRSDSVVKALAYGSKVILSPAKHSYLDMKYGPETLTGLRWAGYVTLRAAYDWDPATQVPALGERDILGVEAPIWSETLRSITAVEYLAVPRIPALAEVAWTPQASRGWDDFRQRLSGQAPRWSLLGIAYTPSVEVAW